MKVEIPISIRLQNSKEILEIEVSSKPYKLNLNRVNWNINIQSVRKQNFWFLANRQAYWYIYWCTWNDIKFLMMMNIGFNFQKTMSVQQYNWVGCGFKSRSSERSRSLHLDHFGIISDQFRFPESHVAINSAFKEVVVIIIVAIGLNTK